MSFKLVIFAIGIAIFLVALAAVLISVPPPIIECKDYDGTCPKGCTFENDVECPRPTLAQPGALFSCFKDEDCFVTKAICDNEDCVYFSDKCRYGHTCFVGINKKFIDVWTDKNVVCAGEIQSLSCPDPARLQPRCIKGSCQV